MKVAIVQYNAGNIQSVTYALERLGITPVLSDNPETLRTADKVIFPGVGEASSAMRYLRNKQLDTLLTSLKQPVLGICLGLQLMCRFSEENNTDCLGIFDLTVKRFKDSKLKVPHIGWNNIQNAKTSLFEGLPAEAYMYYVHSFYAEIGENTIAKSHYINDYSASLHKKNFYAVQFHPEKSSKEGQLILENFLAL
jgi:imidazole glycerol-phosphate synthase subunit HisH